MNPKARIFIHTKALLGRLNLLVFAVCIIFFTGCSDSKSLSEVKTTKLDPWLKIEKAISLIAPDDKNIQKLLSLAKTSKRHWDPATPFYQEFSKYYDDEFIEYTDVMNDESIPSGVFLALMYGSKKLNKFDWKSIFSAEALQWTFDKALQINNLTPLNSKELERLHEINNAKNADTDLEARSEQVLITLESIIGTRKMRILWINGGGDFYEFFLVKPVVAESLNQMQLNDDQTFTQPYKQ